MSAARNYTLNGRRTGGTTADVLVILSVHADVAFFRVGFKWYGMFSILISGVRVS